MIARRITILCFVLAGCAVGPDFERPKPPVDAGYAPQPMADNIVTSEIHGGEPQRLVAGRDVPFDWWKAFKCPGLDSLVEKAFRANPTITSAQAALRQAQEMVYAQNGFFFPTIGADYNFERQQLAGNLGGNSPGVQGNGQVISTYQNPSGPPPFNGPVTFNLHTAQLTVGYTPDVFGLNRRQVESLDAQAVQQRLQLEATYVTLASNVVAAVIQEASTRASIAAARAIISQNERALEILRGQFAQGYAMRLDVAAQETQLAQARQLLPPLKKQFEQTRDLIRVLVGNLPNQDVAQTFDFAALTMPSELPVTVPSMIVERRADVRMAEEQLRGANAGLGIAIADRLPAFTISGSAGGVASQISQIFDTGGPFWSLIFDVSVPIFDGNTLLHRQRAANQALIQAAEQYRLAVLTAYQNVADSLHALAEDADGLKAALDADRAAKVTLDLTRRQLELGYVNYLALITAEVAYQQAELTLIQAQATRFGDTAALYQAMGGGWWNRPNQDLDNTDFNLIADVVSGLF